ELRLVGQRLDNLEKNFLAEIQGVPEIDLRKRMKTCLLRPEHATSAPISKDVFITECLDAFWTWGADAASLPLYADVDKILTSSSDAIKQMQRRSFFEHLGILANLADYVRTGHVVPPTKIPNPVIWAVGANSYVNSLAT